MPCVNCKNNSVTKNTYCNKCIDNNLNQNINRIINDENEKSKFNFLSNKNYLIALDREMTYDVKILKESDNLKKSAELKELTNLKEVTINETKNNLKIIDEDKKQLLINEMRDVSNKLTNIEYIIKEVYIATYILVSKDITNIMHLHGVYSKLEKAMTDYNTIISDLEKYRNVTRLSKLILYKTYMNDFHISLDTSLCDDPEMDVILQKKF